MLSRLKKQDILVFFFFLSFSPLFFYNIGGYTLVDFDEAWFAEVARMIYITKQPFLLFFNGLPFQEHPPLGFIFMALSFALFGVNDFAARFPSALFGFGSIIILYLIGKNLFNRTVGLGAALVLLSSVWFIFRSRSGNLDMTFLFFLLSTFFAAIETTKNYRFIYAVAVLFTGTLLIKSMAGFSIAIPILILFLLYKPKIPLSHVCKAFLLGIGILLPWIIGNYVWYGTNYFTHIIEVGMRTGKYQQPNFLELTNSLTFQYLHFGIARWYRIFIVSSVGSIIFIKKYKQLLPIYIYVVVLLFAFLTNQKTELWHLIPLYPFIGLVISFFTYSSLSLGLNLIRIKQCNIWSKRVTLVILFLFSVMQLFIMRDNIKLVDRETSGLSYAASKAIGRKEPLYLDNNYFLPSPIYYSQKYIISMRSLVPPENNLIGFIDQGPKPALLLTEQWKLDADHIDQSKYKTLAKHRWGGWMLILLQ